MRQRYGRVIGLGSKVITTTQPGFAQVAQSIAQNNAGDEHPEHCGVVRVYWQIASVIAPLPVLSAPRVRIGWTVFGNESRGQLLNASNANDPASRNESPSILCDAWYGSIELSGSGFSVQAGFETEDVPGGSWVLQATITEGGTGAEQRAQFTRIVTLPVGALAPINVRIPGATTVVNNGAARARSIIWHADVRQNVTLVVRDFGANIIDYIETGAIAAPAPYGPTEWPLDPAALSIDVSAGGAAVNGRLAFKYF